MPEPSVLVRSTNCSSARTHRKSSRSTCRSASRADRSERTCTGTAAVRPLLGARQSSGVFDSVALRGLRESRCGHPEADRYRHCCAVARATSEGAKAVAKQLLSDLPEDPLRSTLVCVRTAIACRAYTRCHPEVAFWAMNGVRASSRAQEGKEPAASARAGVAAQPVARCRGFLNTPLRLRPRSL